MSENTKIVCKTLEETRQLEFQQDQAWCSKCKKLVDNSESPIDKCKCPRSISGRLLITKGTKLITKGTKRKATDDGKSDKAPPNASPRRDNDKSNDNCNENKRLKLSEIEELFSACKININVKDFLAPHSDADRESLVSSYPISPYELSQKDLPTRSGEDITDEDINIIKEIVAEGRILSDLLDWLIYDYPYAPCSTM